MLKTTLILALLAAGLPITAVAAAPPAERISFADLDLTSDTGVATLDRRIDAAIDRFCATPGTTDLATKSAEARCRAETRKATAPDRSRAIASAGSERSFALARRN